MSISVIHGDSREVLKTLADASIDSCVTDPPYALVSIVKRFANSPRNERTENTENPYGRTGRGFMGQRWDTGETAFDPTFWTEVRRVLKPGAHLVAFGSTRTYHRIACAIEDAGFEIRDQIGWCYGTGFPKSHNAGDGWGTALKPAWEPICLARNPLIGTVVENIAAHGTGALNIDGCRVDSGGEVWAASGESAGGVSLHALGDGLNNSGKSGGHPAGRWPANVVHDGSDEVLEAFPESAGQQGRAKQDDTPKTNTIYGKFARNETVHPEPRGDSGSAARFFYSAKASKADRAGSKHPTVKPVSLIRYLARLVTPTGGHVLDPFAGSGTLGAAAEAEGFSATLIEREAEYVGDIRRRLGLVPDFLD